MIRFSKKMLALIMSMLMIFSCMAVSASATGTETPGESTETETTTEVVVIPAPECTLDLELLTITVKKPANIYHKDVMYGIKVSIAPSDGVVSSFDADGNYLYSQLTPGTKYVITSTLVDETDDAVTVKGSASTEVTLLKKQGKPANPNPVNITSSSISVEATPGCSFALKNAKGEFVFEWVDSEGKSEIVFGGKDEDGNNILEESTVYTVVSKKKATDEYYESEEAYLEVTTKMKGKTGTPTLKLLDKTNTSITVGVVDAGEGVQYKLNNGAWQASGEFKKLSANTQYNIYARYIFNPAKEDPSATSPAMIVKTNAVANFEADEKKISFIGENGAYANSEIDFTVTGNGPADMNKVVYGDTRIVPIAYSVSHGDSSIKTKTPFTNPNKVMNSGSFTAEDYAEKVVNVKVFFALEEYKGMNEDGTANWVRVKEFDKTFNIELGRVNGPLTKIIEFFEGILNVLLNIVPAFLAEALQSDVWGKLFAALGDLGGAMG